MAYEANKKYFSVLICILFAACRLGVAYEYEYPHLGAADAIANQYLPQAEGETDQFLPQAGIIGTNAAFILNQALKCFQDNYIFNGCGETYRLSQHGELNVEPEYVDEYCKGPCFSETNHVLDCVGGIFKRFIFLNGATLHAVRDTLTSGCSYGPSRGNFNVAEHIQAETAIASGRKVSSNVSHGLVLMVMLWLVFF